MRPLRGVSTPTALAGGARHFGAFVCGEREEGQGH